MGVEAERQILGARQNDAIHKRFQIAHIIRKAIDVREPSFIHRARAPAVAAVVDGIDVEARLQEIPRHFAELFAALRVAVQHDDRARGRRLLVQLGVQRAVVLKRQGKLLADRGQLRLDGVFHRFAVVGFRNQFKHKKSPCRL